MACYLIAKKLMDKAFPWRSLMEAIPIHARFSCPDSCLYHSILFLCFLPLLLPLSHPPLFRLIYLLLLGSRIDLNTQT